MSRTEVVPTEQEANENQAGKRGCLSESKSILDEFASLQTARVRDS